MNAQEYEKMAEEYQAKGQLDKAMECWKIASQLRKKMQEGKYLIIAVTPRSTDEGVINVIAALANEGNEEIISQNNCPPYIHLGAMYPFFPKLHRGQFGGFESEEFPYLIIDEKGKRRVSELYNASSSPNALVCIEYLMYIDEDKFYNIAAMGANLFCSLTAVCEWGWG